ncbi:adenylate cyclase type 2-like [Schistocerca nitens]|uniref:adenylate cyclase type 2-like n=1 Tax=Schistocerca nitens TaxID=7011 RepID=UPI0021177974|nr:adenylate cyclase type 2-like [Schistocerca nitens]
MSKKSDRRAMSAAGLELLTRTSLSQAEQKPPDLRSSFATPISLDERSWSWRHLRHQFRVKNLEELFARYQQRLQDGYFSMLVFVQVLLCAAHITALALAVATEVIYMACINLIGIFFRLLNEIAIRRTFLDHRANIETTFKLQFEKSQEEHLMLSILPRHIVDVVKEDIWSIFQHIKLNQSPLKKKPFSGMYVREHDNVTILYADVVNYASLTVSLPVTKLVETLNELFGKFDEASEEKNVLRIKFLGDCYYCVSGVPNPNPHHAKNCVELGLEMIAIIKEVREERRLNQLLDMRIGIHTGKILSGLLGVCKWQYDVWSRDVIIANSMEQSGKPGRVHITQQTMDQLGNAYRYEEGHGASRNAILQKYNIITYFVISNEHSQEESSNELRPSYNRRFSGGVRRLTFNKSLRARDGIAVASRRRTAFMDNNLHQYQQALLKANEEMSKAIENMKLGLYDRWCQSGKLNPLCLTFEELKWEIPFSQQPDPLFKYYILCSLIVLISILAMQGAKLSRTHWLPWIGYGMVGVFLFILQPTTWTHFLWNKYYDPHGDEGPVTPPQNCIMKFFYTTSERIVEQPCVRTCLYVVVCTSLSLCNMLELAECYLQSVSTDYSPWETGCVAGWHITETCALVLLMSFLFLRMHFQLKLLIGCLITGAYGCVIWVLQPSVFQNSETSNPNLEPQVAHIMYIVFLTFSLHLIDRQSEYMNRLDYLWKRQLSEEQDLSATTRLVNKMLLENILPSHVAELYLNIERTSDELYHEEYDSVAVLFATVTDYTLFDFDHPENSNELVSLRVLNEIICDFDKLLFEPSFLRVEKIKVVGWTYMAACGLDPGRRDSTTSISRQTFPQHVVYVLAHFATRMMAALEKINAEGQQSYRLRVGISHGPITAGVIGAQKPLYDIWGDAVNMASRMDSTGEAGKIQVTENTAEVLEEQGVCCQYRGPTYVKGKNYMTTYFVCMGDNYELLLKPKSPDIINEGIMPENAQKDITNVISNKELNGVIKSGETNHITSNCINRTQHSAAGNSERTEESEEEYNTSL